MLVSCYWCGASCPVDAVSHYQSGLIPAVVGVVPGGCPPCRFRLVSMYLRGRWTRWLPSGYSSMSVIREYWFSFWGMAVFSLLRRRLRGCRLWHPVAHPPLALDVPGVVGVVAQLPAKTLLPPVAGAVRLPGFRDSRFGPTACHGSGPFPRWPRAPGAGCIRWGSAALPCRRRIPGVRRSRRSGPRWA